MSRCGVVIVIVAATLTAASPTPSPSLDSMFAAPPSGYAEDTESSGTPVGEFDLFAYVEYLAPDDPKATTTDLQRDGFVSGYGKSWTHTATGAGFAALVVAFGGAQGARKWLASTGVSARHDQYYQGELTVAGIGPYVGVRYGDPQSGAHADVVSFVKGNDFFLVGFVADSDMADAATTQAKTEYDFAPAESIPRAQWPENVRAPLFGLTAARLAVALLLVGLGTTVAAALAVLIALRRRPPPGAPT